YQSIEGFGGALTEAVAVTLDKAGKKIRERVLRDYFDPKAGLNYNLCRTHINSCDFSTENYHYTQKNDYKLQTFDIKRDKQLLIPLINDAQKIRGEKINMLSSPWSPPDWMKTTGRMNQGGKLKPDCRKVWAEYYSKYIEAYEKENVKIKYLTVQNEPKAKQSWDSCIYTAEEEKCFVKNYLGPSLKRNGHKDVRLLVWDHNKERVFERGNAILSDPFAAEYIWGTAFHWYSGDHFEALSLLHEKFPDKGLIFTEGCLSHPESNEWSKGEKYAHDIIGNLNNWAQGFIDWNIALDRQGGPNHVGNFCDAPIIVDTTRKKIIYKPSFYYIAHFSKFINPGSKRIAFSKYTSKLEVTAVKNLDESIAVIVMNSSDDNMDFILRCKGYIANFAISKHSIVTLLFKNF
ncbi:MAG TPA: glycoside hydrolase family 30 protein, partial [Victivallales bacterium]|nr:glycoside hydrolase family 30 protein [Victivallales bacterium]